MYIKRLEKRCNKLFDDFNSRYFNSKLRKVPVKVKRCRNSHLYETQGFCHFEDLPVTFITSHIEIQLGGEEQLPNWFNDMLLHEMVHHAIDDGERHRVNRTGHSRKFVKECIRVYNIDKKHISILGSVFDMDDPKMMWLLMKYMNTKNLLEPFDMYDDQQFDDLAHAFYEGAVSLDEAEKELSENFVKR